jgi:hypothetical protein
MKVSLTRLVARRPARAVALVVNSLFLAGMVMSGLVLGN